MSEKTESFSEGSKEIPIIIAGDVTLDWIHWEDEEKLSQQSNWRDGYNQHDVEFLNGGALLIADILRNFGYNSQIITHKEIKPDSKLLNSMSILAKFDKIDKNAEPYRVKQFFGFKKPKVIEIPDIKFKNEKSARIITIVDDSGNNFSIEGNKGSWEQIVKRINKDTLFIHKISRHLPNKDMLSVWDKIENKGNLFVIITAEDLRNMGLRISKSLSWERTAYDFLKEMKKIRRKTEDKIEDDPDTEKLKELSKCKNFIVRLGIDGAILYQNTGKNGKYTLFFDPKCFEGDFEQKYLGKMQGLGSAFVSGIIHGFITDKNLEDGIKRGIIACRELHKLGFVKGNDNNKSNSTSTENHKKMNYPFEDIFKKLDAYENIECSEYDKENWKILDDTDINLIYQKACKIVKYGESDNLKVPIARFEKLSTADRGEIESFHSIKNLINEYINKKTNIPLSIAVFGPPGTGKSFAVTQIARTIRKDIEPLEFNLSQFQSPKDLFNAFHIVQSTVLSGKIPLVFFDEFDSKLNNEKFGWLKYFLAPMNDGKFKTGDIIHPIGKCIFVFAGGTKKTFDEFDKDKTKEKGSDFVSRLRGYVDIKGINKKNYVNTKRCYNEMDLKFSDEKHSVKIRDFIELESEIYIKDNGTGELPEDNHYMIRRAFVLRNILKKNAENIFKYSEGKEKATIDDSVLNALIKVSKYRHGIRSIEAIIEMSMLSNKKKFDRSALPPKEQTRLHVDVEEFKYYLDNPKKCKERLNGKNI